MGRHVIGGDKVSKMFANKAKRTRQLVSDVVKLNGTELAQEAQRRAPYKTGNLKSSIRMDFSSTATNFKATVEEHTEYGKYLELGTRFMEAQPYMAPATMIQRRKFLNDMAKVGNK